MRYFLARRVIETLITLLATCLLVFLMLHAVPGDPVQVMFGEYGASAAQIETLRKQLGLDRPLWEQFAIYVARLAQGDLGISFKMNRPVSEVLMTQLPQTIELALAAILIAVVVGLVTGVVAALYHNTFVDTVMIVVTLVGISIPSFWLGLLLIILFAYHLRWLPAIGGSGVAALVLPSVTLGLWAAGSLARLVRSSMLDLLHQDFVRTARAKGLANGIVVWKHVLRNACIPVITMIGVLAGNALSGAIIVEAVFSRSGIGRTLVTSIVSRDLPMVQGTVLLTAAMFLFVNLLVDLSYGVLDPRIMVGADPARPRRVARIAGG